MPTDGSSSGVNDVMKACACVPLTGMPHNFPAKTLLVPSNPKNEIKVTSKTTLLISNLTLDMHISLPRMGKAKLDNNVTNKNYW